MKIKILSKQYQANVKYKTNTVYFELDGKKIYIDIMYVDSSTLGKRNVFVGNNRYDELEEYINKNYNCGFEKFKKVFLSELRKYSRNRNLDPIKEYEDRNQEFKESKIYKFNDCDTVYIPKGYTLQEAIDWYTREYDSIDDDVLSEVNYLDGFWDCDVPKERADEIYKDNPSNFDIYGLSKDKKVKEGTIEYRYGDLYIYKTFKTAKEENDKLDSEIFIICSTEF